MALSSRVGGIKSFVVVTAAGRRKERAINKTARRIFHNDVKTLAEQTHKMARRLAPKNTGRLRNFILLEQVPTGEGIEMWRIDSKNPVPGSPVGYRRGGNDTTFDLAYWAHKSSRAAAHFGGKDKYIYKAEEWAEKKRDDYVRRGRYKQKFKKFKR